MAKKRKRLPLAIILVIAAACLGLLVELTLRPLHRAYNEYILDNYDHNLPCARLPQAAEVERVLREQAGMVAQIEAVHPGHTSIEIDPRSESCPGKADLVIYYASHADRAAIEALLGGRTFYGIPARWRNI